MAGSKGRTLALALCMALGAAATFAQPAPQTPVHEVQVGASQFERGAPLPDWVEPYVGIPESRDQKSAAVTLLADTQFSVAQDAWYAHRLWRVNAASALSDIGQQSIDFNPTYQRVRLHALRVHRGGQVLDKLAAARISFLQREAGLEQGVYSGDVVAAMLVDDLRVGDVLELAYSRIGSNPVFGGKFLETASWDAPIPTEVRRITLLQPPERPIAWKFATDVPDRATPVPQESVHAGQRRLRWETRGLAAAEVEQAVPPDVLSWSFLQFTEYRSWAEVADWARQLFAPEGAPPPALLDVASQLRQRATPEARAAAALQWVQNEIRYVSLSLGESSHRPAPPATTLARRYGDCKDKSMLLVQLLAALDIPARPVLVSSRTLKGQSRVLPSPFVFDHAIVEADVGGRSWFLDPTRLGQGGRLESMGQVWEGAEVLRVAQGTTGFTTIASPDVAAITRDELTERIRIPRLDGEAQLEVRLLVSGAMAEARRLSLARMPEEVLQRITREMYEERYPGLRHAAPARVEDDPEQNVLALVMTFAVPRIATPLPGGGAWAVRFRPANLSGSLRSATGSRKLPLALPQRGRMKYSVEVEFPPEVSKITDPLQRVVRDGSFQYEFNMGFRGNRATATAEMNVLSDRVEPVRTAAYQANLRRTSEHPFAFIVDKGDIKSAGFLGLGAPSLQQTIQARLKDRVGKITTAIEGGRLVGEDLAEALCERGESLLDLGQAEAGLKDAQAALRAGPNMARAHACLGNTRFGVGDYQRAIADYTRAISLDPDQPHVFYRRGHARYYARQYAAAADDFAKAGMESKTGDEDAMLYAELWRVWAQKRQGAAPSRAQLELASRQPDGEWPRPALALFHGQRTVEQMLQSLERKKGDEREMALVEGYFYAGQWYLLQGDTTRAAEYFAKAREKGVTIYIEHVGAGIELGQLGAAPVR